uniref:Uncharacterized protein n=1 Tax=Arundo donax TaxID=35708 RepID=A0A0A9EY27_ARUDO
MMSSNVSTSVLLDIICVKERFKAAIATCSRPDLGRHNGSAFVGRATSGKGSCGVGRRAAAQCPG